jgi:hypothetical protein
VLAAVIAIRTAQLAATGKRFIMSALARVV